MELTLKVAESANKVDSGEAAHNEPAGPRSAVCRPPDS